MEEYTSVKIAIRFNIEPISCPRPRFNRYTGRTFKTEGYALFLDEIYYILLKQFPVKPMIDKLLKVNKLVFSMPIAKTVSKKRHDYLLGQYYDGNKDLDNMQKAIFDAMNDYIYVDDKQIVEINGCKKVYSDEPSIYIEMETV